jgi:GntR family transcriptional regulator
MTWASDAGITLDPRADVPVGVQLAWALRAAIAAGRIHPGERLPGLRELADAVGVNHNTLRAVVARLEGDGLLERRHGTGTFVAADAVAHARHAELVAQAAAWATDAGLTPRDLAAALYVTPPPAPRTRDGAADERRALRDDIAVLERVLAQIEDPFTPRGAEEPPRGSGATLLTADDLREQRAALIRRLGAAQDALDGAAEEPVSAPSPARQRAARPAVRRARPATG